MCIHRGRCKPHKRTRELQQLVSNRGASGRQGQSRGQGSGRLARAARESPAPLTASASLKNVLRGSVGSNGVITAKGFAIKGGAKLFQALPKEQRRCRLVGINVVGLELAQHIAVDSQAVLKRKAEHLLTVSLVQMPACLLSPATCTAGNAPEHQADRGSWREHVARLRSP